jgi:hypothetical protein
MCSLDARAEDAALDYLLVLALPNPVLLPLLEPLFDATLTSGKILHSQRVLAILADGTDRKRSDAMAWTLYFTHKYSISIPVDLAERVLRTADCIAILTLYATGQHIAKVVTWAKALDRSDPYLLDRYWLLLYQLYRDGHIGANYGSVPDAFVALQASNVSFVK